MVEAATPADAPFLADCWKAMLEELSMAPGGLVPDWRERLARSFAAGMEAGSQGFFVARAPDGTPIASAGAIIPETAMVMAQRLATIGGVYVQPAYRRRGIAKQLTEAAIEWARDHGCRLVRLSASEPAESLYRRMGFVPGRELVLRLDLD